MRFKYRFNYDRWPLVIVRIPSHVETHEIDHDSLYAEFDRLRARQTKCFVLHDLRGVSNLGPERRRRFADYANEHVDFGRDYVGGFAVLLDSAVMRGVVTAILWFVNPPCPMRVFTKETEAEDWLRSLMTAQD